MSITKVTVLGAGAMGSQIAAHFVNIGLKVRLLDIVIDQDDRNKLVKEAYKRITDRRKGLLYDANWANNLTIGNFEDDLDQVKDADLIVEAVAERLDIKHDLWGKVTAVANDHAIFATNTSGIPIGEIAKPFADAVKKRFVGLHFFNPVRFMKLVEIIKHDTTDPEIVDKLADFTTYRLGKGVVLCNDVSGFVGNRIGAFTGSDIFYRAEKLGLAVNEIDALTGEILARPRMGLARLSDFTGADIGYHVNKGMKSDPAEADYFLLPETTTILMEKGWLGDKSGQGLYKKLPDRSKLIFDLKTQDYVSPKPVEFDILSKFGKNLKENFNTIFEATDEIGLFLWESLRNLFLYSAVNVGKATDDYKNIDRAMVWGYNWKLGPFQIWDLMGFERVRDRILAEIDQIPGQDTDLPAWIKERSQGFYDKGDSISTVPAPSSFIASSIWNKKGSSSLDVTEDGVLLFQMLTPNNTLTNDYQVDLVEAIDLLESGDYKGMVLYSPGPHFSLGANLDLMAYAIEHDLVDAEIAPGVVKGHKAMARLKYAAKPIVSAVSGRALGGGAEIAMHSPFIVAAAETYIGLVEVGVGLIPGCAGLVELADRVYRQNLTPVEKKARLAGHLMSVATAYVSPHAYQAREKGFLRDTDVIIQNEELVVQAAIDKVRLESSFNYIPISKPNYAVFGSDLSALFAAQLDSLRDGNRASDHDVLIGRKAGEVLAGGNIPPKTIVNEDQLMKIEAENFVFLSKQEKTYDRIKHMLATRKPLRN